MSNEKRKVCNLADLDFPEPIVAKIKRLGGKIADLSSLLADYEDLKSTYMTQLADLTGDIDYNIRGDGWTYEEVSGRTHLSEEKLLEFLPISKIAKCKIRGKSYRQIRRDREKKEKA